MNKQQRAEISNAFSDIDFSVEHIMTLETVDDREEYAKSLEDLKEKLEGIRDDEQEKFDNMPESLQSSGRGSKLEENVEELDAAINDIEAAINDIRGEYPSKPNESSVEDWAAGISDSIEAAESTADAL